MSYKAKAGDLVRYDGQWWVVSWPKHDSWWVVLPNANGNETSTSIQPCSGVMSQEEAFDSPDPEIRQLVRLAYSNSFKITNEYRRGSERHDRELASFKRDCRKLIVVLAPEKAELIGELWQSMEE